MLLSSKENLNIIEVVLTTTSLTHWYTPTFHDFNVGFDRPIDGGNNSNPLAWPYWEEWQLLIRAETTKQLIREKSLACIGKTKMKLRPSEGLSPPHLKTVALQDSLQFVKL